MPSREGPDLSKMNQVLHKWYLVFLWIQDVTIKQSFLLRHSKVITAKMRTVDRTFIPNHFRKPDTTLILVDILVSFSVELAPSIATWMYVEY